MEVPITGTKSKYKGLCVDETAFAIFSNSGKQSIKQFVSGIK